MDDGREFVPISYDNDGKPTLYRWNIDTLRGSMTAPTRRNFDRRHKVTVAQIKLFKHIPWMRWPVLNYCYSFWAGLFEEGIVNTCKPRWGSITFGWLNDGMKPTVWHTWRQLTHNHVNDPYTGIYPSGAPKSLKQAQEWENKWEKERLDKEMAPIRETEGWDW